jgi:hypothetical protein
MVPPFLKGMGGRALGGVGRHARVGLSGIQGLSFSCPRRDPGFPPKTRGNDNSYKDRHARVGLSGIQRLFSSSRKTLDSRQKHPRFVNAPVSKIQENRRTLARTGAGMKTVIKIVMPEWVYRASSGFSSYVREETPDPGVDHTGLSDTIAGGAYAVPPISHSVTSGGQRNRTRGAPAPSIPIPRLTYNVIRSSR